MGRTRVLLASESAEHPAGDALGPPFEIDHVGSLDGIRHRLERDRVDCVVLDQSLDGGDWQDAVGVIESSSHSVPAVLCPVDGSESLASAAFRTGVSDYVPASEVEERLADQLENIADANPFTSHGSFRALAESVTDAIVAIDAEGDIRFSNDALERVLGYESEEIVGEPLTVLMPKRLHDSHREGLRQYLETGERQLDWERITLPGRHRDGRERSLAITFGEFDHGSDHFFVGILRDITEQKRREKQLERHNEQLEELITALAHDLRTPLNVARGRIDTAQSSIETEKTRVDLESARDALDQMSEMITDLLELAQQGLTVSDLEDVSLIEVVDAAWGMAETGDLELSHSGDLGTIRADPTRVSELLQNLFTNAAVHAEGATTVRVGRLERSNGFYVADDGAGIPPEKRDRVFETGFTTGEEGTGFGLAIVRRIAKAHDWTVKLRASESGGARFEVRFD